MRKLIAAILILGSTPFIGLAQDSFDPEAAPAYNRVLIVPYHPNYYISDSDREMADFSQMDAREMRKIFRQDLDAYVSAAVKQNYDAEQILINESDDAQADLRALYGAVSYRYDTTSSYLRLNKERTQRVKINDLKKRFQEKLMRRGEYNPMATKEKDDVSLQFLDAKIRDQETITNLSQKYRADLIVFVNQLEVKINYNNCIDLANKVYNREFKMHFSVYTAQGEKVFGDVVTTIFPSDSNDLEMITRNNFPLMAAYLIKNLPGGAPRN